MSRFQGQYVNDWRFISRAVRDEAGNCCIRCGHADSLATGHVLTVHHFDGQKDNNAWYNLLALCQRCHLSFQSRVIPQIPYFLEHSSWLKPYVAGFYAVKYEGKQLTREEVMARLEELLRYECAVS